MRIAVDVRRFRDFGVGTYIRNLIGAFHRLAPPHHFLLIGSPADEAEIHGLAPGFEFVAHATSDLNRLDHFAMARLVRRLKVDLTHVPLARVSLFLPSPYIVTIHDVSSLLFDAAPGWLHSARVFRFSTTVKRAACVIAVSAATKRDVVEMTGLEQDGIRVVHNAPDPSFFKRPTSSGPTVESRAAERRRTLERYQITYPFLLYAGHIRPQKNIPRMIEGFAVARQALAGDPIYQSLRLIIIGDDIYRHPEVRRAVIQTRVEDCVRFLGFVPFQTLRVFYELATAFLFPSLYEGFGLPPLEAMAAGTPVITSSVSSLPEVVGDAAVIVNPENVFDIARGICELLRDSELRDQLVARGRVRASSFSWTTAASETLQIYEAAAAQRQASGAQSR